MFETNKFEAYLARTIRASRFAERLCHAHPALPAWLLKQAEGPLSADLMRSNLLTDSADEAEFHASLRNLRRHAMLHSIFRDINGLASLDEIVTTI